VKALLVVSASAVSYAAGWDEVERIADNHNVEVSTRAKETTAATLTLDQRISRDGVDLFTAEVMVVLISASGKPQRLAMALREALQMPNALSAKRQSR